VKFTRAVAVLVALFYVFLWVLDLNGVSSLTPVLVVPPVLAALVAFGVWLNKFMGIAPRRPRFEDPTPRNDAPPVVSDVEAPTPLDVPVDAPVDAAGRARAPEDPPA
jgi:hypothetical protein